MQSIVQKKSYGSVTVYWLDREAAVEAVRSAARRLARNDSSIRRVVLFGSLAAGTATAASDADVLVIVDHTNLSLLDRPVAYHDHFADVGLPAEVFVFTEAEIESDPPPIAAHALQHGLSMLDETAERTDPTSRGASDHC